MIRLCALADLTEGEILRAEIDDGHGVAVYLLEGEVFVSDDLCTHGDASLAEGEIEGCRVVCPFHMGTFDIRTGEATGAPCSIDLKVYPVQIIDDEVHIEI